MAPPYDVPASIGVPAGTLSSVVVTPANDVIALTATLKNRDVAAAIIEPTGGAWGTMPIRPAFLHELLQATRATGTLLILDEVITGFRVAPARPGALQRPARPDHDGKNILAGGLPGGAVAGRADILGLLDFSPTPKATVSVAYPTPAPSTQIRCPPRQASQCSTCCSTPPPIRQSGPLEQAAARRISDHAIAAAGVEGCCYGDCSMFHVLLDNIAPATAPKGTPSTPTPRPN